MGDVARSWAALVVRVLSNWLRTRDDDHAREGATDEPPRLPHP